MKPGLDFVHEFVPGSLKRTLLLLHGTGGNERDLIPLGREIDPTAAILSPRGKILENGMPRFFFGQWYLLCPKNCRIFHLRACGSARETETRLFRRQRLSAW